MGPRESREMRKGPEPKPFPKVSLIDNILFYIFFVAFYNV
jgi:hypothetical protein